MNGLDDLPVTGGGAGRAPKRRVGALPERTPEEQRQDEAQALLDATPPAPEPDEMTIAAERAAAARLRALGPEPHPELPSVPNPSDYHPPEPDATPPESTVEDFIPPNPSVLPPPPRKEERAGDERQRWICVSDVGIRTSCPAFHSDAHMLGNMVGCETCGSTRVRKVAKDEVLREDVPVPV